MLDELSTELRALKTQLDAEVRAQENPGFEEKADTFRGYMDEVVADLAELFDGVETI